MAEHPEVFRHVGLLINEPPAGGLTQTGRVALYLVIRLISLIAAFAENSQIYSPSAYFNHIERYRESKENVAVAVALS